MRVYRWTGRWRYHHGPFDFAQDDLTAVAIKAAKGRAKPYKLTDSDGLHLLVLPSGGRYWRINYRYLGKQKTLALGVWPDVELADARAKRDETRRLLAKGIDPAAQTKLDKVAASVAATNTFQAVADEWIAKIEREGLSPVMLGFLRQNVPRNWESFSETVTDNFRVISPKNFRVLA
jgi:hypothetical protein